MSRFDGLWDRGPRVGIHIWGSLGLRPQAVLLRLRIGNVGAMRLAVYGLGSPVKAADFLRAPN
eukprot:6510390-Pyramimonas_sp.AAC.1